MSTPNPPQQSPTQDKVGDGSPSSPTQTHPEASPSKSTSIEKGILGFFQKLGLLVWKNLIMRKRSCCFTCMEISFFQHNFRIAVWLSGQRYRGPGFPTTVHVNSKEYSVLNEAVLVDMLRIKLSCEGCFVAYAPEGGKADEIMAKVNELVGDIDKTNENSTNSTNSSAPIRFRGYPNEQAIIKIFDDPNMTINLGQYPYDPNNLDDPFRQFKSRVYGAIIFKRLSGGPITYTLRLVDTNRFETNLLFPSELSGLEQWTGNESIPRGKSYYYAQTAFLGLQILLEKSIAKAIFKQDMDNISIQAFPEPAHTERPTGSRNFMAGPVPILIVLQMLFTVPILVTGVIGEGVTGVRELLKLNGLPGWMQWLGWMINAMIAFSIPVTFYTFAMFISLGGDPMIELSDPTVWWTVLFLYGMAGTAFCFFISSLFSNAALGTITAIVIWIGSYFGFWYMILTSFTKLPLWVKLALGLMPNDGLQLALHAMIYFETIGEGARWSNLAEPISSNDSFSVFIAMLMLIVDIVIYTFLAIYLENVWPSKFGVRKPWYYIFLCGWNFKKRSVAPAIDNGETREGFEAEPTDIPVGIEIKNLRKTFGRKKAVDGVSAKMYQGEIFALLGHNGAGKTTTISVLTGMTAPTSGTAIINSFDIRSDLERVRENLGLCPQENMLFNKLTVMEHLLFFGQLKGLNRKEAVGEGEEILNTLQLTEKKNVISKKLSGGQQRKLSLGIALTGGAKVVVLDEPTSGMDPEARRALWDCLLSIRQARTILLTTHFMEEADVLGDRIGIMAEGRMQCCGTPAFLKKFYGTGYVLKVIISGKSDPNQVLSFVQSQVPGAEIKSTYAANVSEVLISLPGETTTATLATLFTQLSSKKDALGMQGVGLSPMDDVFVRVGELADDQKQMGLNITKGPDFPKEDLKLREAEGKVDGTNDSGSTSNPANSEETPVHPELLVPKRGFGNGASQFFQQVWGLLVKKWIYTFHNYGLLFTQLILPVILMILIILLCNLAYQPDSLSPSLNISIDSYRKPVVLYSLPAGNSTHLKSVVGPSVQEASDKSINKAILNWKSDRLSISSLNERHIIGIEVGSNVTKAMFNYIPHHAAPLAINVMTNYLLEKAKPGANHTIKVVNHPLTSKGKDLLDIPQEPTPIGLLLALMLMPLVMIAIIVGTSTFVVFPIEERVPKAKQLQLMTGVSPITYWATCFLCDYLTILVTISLIIFVFPIFESFKIYSTLDGLISLFLILATFSFSAIALAYLLSFRAGTSTGGFAICVVIHLLTGILLPFISTFIRSFMSVKDKSGSKAASFKMGLTIFGRLSPSFGTALSIHRWASVAAHNGKCPLLSREANVVVCQNHDARYKDYAECCFKTCPSTYLTWSFDLLRWRNCPEDNKQGITLEEAGILQELFWVAIIGFVYFFIILVMEYWQDVLGLVNRRSKKVSFMNVETIPDINDEDVLEESQRVSEMVSSRNFSDALAVDSLSKTYGSFAAVAGVSFGVHHGECFGLLGVNGAGKTTTFRMLTGDEWRSSGNAYAFGNTLDENRSKFFANIGYCPQFDGIIGVLSGRQMLQLFARLRGVPIGMVGVEADKWLEKLGLSESATVQCRKYSGGMKRRLCAGMAMIGDPPLLLLDEPTSGVDPVSRRRFWVVLESLKQSGQSVILTSHSMEECEALCSRLAIMVNGQLQCFGGVQHLKAKYGQAYKLSVTVSKSVEPELMKREEDLSNKIIAKFEPCLLKDKHQGVMVYDIQNVSISYSTIFQSMEEMKKKYEGILQDYTVSETSLEDVFLSFARAQYGERKGKPSLCGRICS